MNRVPDGFTLWFKSEDFQQATGVRVDHSSKPSSGLKSHSCVCARPQARLSQHLCLITRARSQAGCGVRTVMVYQREIIIQTSGHKDMHNLTDEVGRIVNESKVR